MELSDEQIKNIREQLIEQINSTFPEDKKQEAIEKVNSMTPDELIEFLKQNNMIKDQEGETQHNPEKSQQKCIFCSIVFGETNSYKIDEDEKALAVLEINPISKGHVLILPKEHISEKEKVEEQTKELTEKIKHLIKKTISPKEIITSYSEFFSHGSINLIPVYTNETTESQRKQATKEELEEMQKKFQQNKEEKQEKKQQEKKQEPEEKQQEINEKNTWLPKRIP